MNDKVIRRYCTRVKRCLCCGKQRKEEMAAGLMQELLEHDLPDNCTMKQLYGMFGMPDEVAQTLSEDIPKEEFQAFQYRKKVRKWIFTVCILAVLIFCTFEIYRLADAIHEYNEISEARVEEIITEYHLE